MELLLEEVIVVLGTKVVLGQGEQDGSGNHDLHGDLHGDDLEIEIAKMQNFVGSSVFRIAKTC